MSKQTRQVTPEWPYPVPAEEVGKTPLQLSAEASEEERRAVARRLGLVALEDLKAEVFLARDRNEHIIHVWGTLFAEAVQECVVSLEPVKTEVEAPVEGWFADNDKTVSFARARRERLKEKTGIDVPVLEEQDDPEPMVNGTVDIGELVVQSLSLSIPQYPHKEGVSFEKNDEEREGEQKSDLRKNPFEALKNWKSK